MFPFVYVSTLQETTFNFFFPKRGGKTQKGWQTVPAIPEEVTMPLF